MNAINKFSSNRVSLPHPDFEANKKRAELFAEEKDPFRRPKVQEKYDCMRHTVEKIQASSHCIFFSKIFAKQNFKPAISTPISYNCSCNEFDENINSAYNNLKIIE